ncbi:MAG: hypothetical protein ABR863_10960 [Roseiarcus sp.]|jgi:hypothetical protein
MNAAALVDRARDDYVRQFEAFAADLRRKCPRGAAELKLRLSERSRLFQRLYCIDFIADDGKPRPMEFELESVLPFEPISVAFGAATLSIERLCWDDVQIRHDLAELPVNELATWFRRWFDPNDERTDANAPLSGVIHSLYVRANLLDVDFGTASPEAFWNLVKLLERAGAATIWVGGSRAEDRTSAQ